MSTEYEHIVDLAYADWLKQSKKENRRRKHPSREEYGVLFRQIFPWAGAITLVIQETEEQPEVQNG
jgi:hypothetical protein